MLYKRQMIHVETKDPTQRRMGVLVPVGSTVFLLKGVYNILVATGVIDRYVPLAFPHTSHLESRLMWDGLFGCITEAMPVAMVVYLTSSSRSSAVATSDHLMAQNRQSLNVYTIVEINHQTVSPPLSETNEDDS
eukprot:GHVH01013276.1.p1 GENE.GHVH01013276.1~~GHVH01013276.1.p1  ORF type:complete len:134 (-),score=11.47 GHVH01013276.1:528-929(-)